MGTGSIEIEKKIGNKLFSDYYIFNANLCIYIFYINY